MWGRQLIYVFLTWKRTLVLSKTGGTSSVPIVPSVPTSSNRVPPLSSPFQIGFRHRRFRLHLDFSKMGKVGKNHGQSACASRQKRDTSGKFTRGCGIEVVPEVSGGWEIPSAAECAPEASAGREIPSAFELALRSIARRGCAPAPAA
jgi:hypothetical protein